MEQEVDIQEVLKNMREIIGAYAGSMLYLRLDPPG